MQGRLAVWLLAALSAAPALEAQDVVRIGSRTGVEAGEVLAVPVTVRDRAGTALDSGTLPQREIHSFSVTVEASPAGAVAGLDVVRAGLTAPMAPRFETVVGTGARRSWIASFAEPVEFSGGAEVVALVLVEVAPGAAPGSVVELALGAETTALSSSSGTLVETAANGGLSLVDGRLEIAGTGCTTATTLCLLDDRFRVEVAWRDFADRTGSGTPVELTDETGYFWFFDDSNVELVIKALDGRGTNDHFWIFFGALTNVEYEITVTDSVTGAVQRYFNPAGTFASFGDVEAFPDPAASAPVAALVPAAAAAIELPWRDGVGTGKGSCAPSSTRLCLLGGRFALEMTWQDFEGDSGVGRPEELSDETGYFWFFDPDNVEIIVKTLDGRGTNGRFWVFYGSLSNVEFTLEVTDTVTGERRTYRNPLENFASVGDIEAF